MKTKSAKDLAFERERLKLQRQKHEVEEKLREKNKTIEMLCNKISELEMLITQKDEWIERLLDYTELSKEDLAAAIEKDKSMAEAAKSLKMLMNLSRGFY